MKKTKKLAKKANKRSKQNATLLDELCGTGASVAGSETCTAPQGPKGDKGDKGATGATGPSTGPAGGDLTGNYPNPSIANGAVGTQEHSGAIPAAGAIHLSAQTISTGGFFTTLAFDDERYDTANMHTNVSVNSRLTAPVTGIYEVGASIEWASTGAATPTRSVRLLKNGSTILGWQEQTNADILAQAITRVVRLEVGDFVQVQVFQDSGSDKDVRKMNEFSPEFTMTWLAPGP